tara:strand:+ start:1930 stop:2151 length:222 start_codon:yes stop_codon:yes gene_type:complete
LSKSPSGKDAAAVPLQTVCDNKIIDEKKREGPDKVNLWKDYTFLLDPGADTFRESHLVLENTGQHGPMEEGLS